MRLTSVELIGFKSFAKKTTIRFPSGITEIVGPNGSGKSNVIEAIRWALGEQSAKNLRSNRMTDVIFSGSQSHPALNRAKVVLTFDNSDHYIDVNYTKLQVARIVYRDGTNNYYLNGKPCRLRDIQGLFMNTGIGNGSFSIISQGKVAQIFRSKPVDRRFIIETVAGIYKYRNQKVAADQKLTHVDDNLTRIGDINYELGRQRHRLVSERRVAQIYLRRKKLANRLDITRLLTRLYLLNQKITKLKAQIQTVGHHFRDLTTRSKQFRIHSQKLQSRLNRVSNGYTQLQDRILNCSQRISDLSNQQRLNQQQVSFWSRQIQHDQKRLLATSHQVTQAKSRLVQLKSTQDRTLQQQRRLTNVINKLKASDRAKLIRQNQSKLQRLRSQYIDLIQRSTKIGGLITNQHQTDSDRKARLHQLTVQVSEIKRSVTVANRQLSITKPKIINLKRKVQRASHQTLEQRNRYGRISRQINSAAQNYNQILRREQLLKARFNGLKQMMIRHSNLRNGSRNLLAHSRQFPGIIGLVAKYLTVPTKYVQAIETTLRSQLQQIIVNNSQTAKRVVQFMTQNRLGRVTLLPVNGISKRWINPGIVAQCRRIKGFIDVASNLVKMPDQLNVVKEHLLGNVLIASDITAAIQISRLINHRYRIVTLNGNVINAGGAITGGQGRYRYHGLLSQKAKAIQIRKVITQLVPKLRQQQSKGRDLQKLRSKIEASLEQVQESNNQNRQTLAVQQHLYNRLMTELKNHRDESSEHQILIKKLNQNSAGKTEVNLKRRKSKIESQLTATQHQIHRIAHWIQDQSQAMDQYNKRYQNYREAMIKAKDRGIRVASTVQRTLSMIKQNRDRSRNLRQVIKTVTQKIRRVTRRTSQSGRSSGLQKAIKSLKEQKQRYRTLNQRDHQSIIQVNRQISLIRNRLIKAHELLNQHQLSVHDLNQKRHEVVEVLRRKYQIDLNGSVPRPKTSLYHVSSKLFTVQKQLRSIGPVNVNAIKRYQKVNRRYQFLSRQIKDLITSKHQLLTTMNQMNSKIKLRFKKTFDQVNRAFKITYSQIFRGGKAKLKLIDPNHLLTTGIDIMAQPPGKRYRNMELLSGGERALTAIALLFAILRVKPAPFCILDEAESALDAVNIDRFGEYMRKLEKRTQFIVITHRKTTMLYADNLYGITMQDSGISKIISVNLRKAKVKG